MKTQHLFIFVFLLIVAVIAIFTSTATKAATLTVDDSGGQQYTTIQAAVNVASTGDTVYVCSGTYYEHITISKTINLTGENPATTKIKRDGNYTGISVSANFVNVSNFWVDDFDNGMVLSSSNCTITSNIITNNTWGGLGLSSSSDSTISYNNISNNDQQGISMSFSLRNKIIANTITNNGWGGMSVGESSNNNITANIISNNGGNGIHFCDFSLNNILVNNTVTSSTGYDLSLIGSSTATTINTTFDRNKVGTDSSLSLTVKNYLNVEVKLADSTPLTGASVTIFDNSVLVASGQTNAYGFFNGSIITDRTHDASNVITEHTTTVTISYAGLLFNSNNRNVDMSTSHTESFTALANQVPTPHITTPNENQNFACGNSISFTGYGTDVEDGTLTGSWINWTSNVTGYLGSGNITVSTLSLGKHNIKLNVTDKYGATVNTTVNITIFVPNNFPTAYITAPAEGQAFFEGRAINFTGYGIDTEDGFLTSTSITWTSNISGCLGTGNITKDNLPRGSHRINLTVTDSSSQTGNASVNITVASNNTVRNNNTGIFYSTIQDAINASNSGDTVYVYNRTYYEHIVINKALNLVGEGQATTIIDGSGSGTVISISTSGVGIRGFTIRNSGNVWPNAGIGTAASCDSTYIAYNTITNNLVGLYFGYRSHHTTEFNNIYGNQQYGLCNYYYEQGTGGNALNNWWGGVSGPTSGYGVPNGTEDTGDNGDIITSGSNYNPWAKSPIEIAIKNNNTGVYYWTIQGAINASNPGDTIYVSKGIYYEHLVINKTLTLIGQNRSNTKIDGGDTGAIITINADYVNVSGFLMRNSGSTGSDAAVKITSSANHTTIAYNTMIDTIYGVSVDTGSYNNISHNNIINSISGLTIQWSVHNTVTYNNITNSNYYGLYLGYSSYNNVTSNNASNNGWYGISLASGSMYSATNYNTINYNTVTNNTLDGIYIYSASNNDIRYNNIYDNKQNGMRVDVNCADTGNTVSGSWWGNASGPYNDTANPSGTGDNITLGITFSPWALSPIDIYAAQPPTQLCIRNITVSASGGKDYTKIQDAINASLSGDTVYVYNGTYNESITINKTINLVGESNQSAIINRTSMMDSSGIYVTASYVNISNMKVDNFDFGIHLYYGSNNITSNTIANCSRYGIYLFSSSNNTITSNTVANCSGDDIYLFSSSNNTITSNTLSEGIFLDPTSASTATIENNTVGGKSLYFAKDINSTTSPTYIENSVYGQVILYNCSGFVIRNNVFSKATLLLLSSSNNTITSNTIANCSSGIYLYCSSNNTITSNTIANCSYGIYLYYYSSNNTITSNTVTNCSDSGICLSGSNNTITSNTVTNCSGDGIYLAPGSNNTITSNTVTNCSGDGIYLLYSSYNTITLNTVANCGDDVSYLCIYLWGSSYNTITSNNIYGNKQYGLYLYSGTGNTAYNNWWGDASGPYNAATNPTGTGDNITDGVPFSPWLKHPFDKTIINNNTSIYYATIQDAINASSPGDTVYVSNGTYYEHLVINKTLSLIGENQNTTIIDGSNTADTVVSITANYVNMSGFTVRNSGSYDVRLISSSNSKITGNTISNSGGGIDLALGSNNTVAYNTISNCFWWGVTFASSNDNTVAHNAISNCGDGIWLCESSGNTIAYNNICGNRQYGVNVYLSGTGTVNTAYNNWWGNVSGPYNATTNPGGTGDNITGDILFSPWATAPFTVGVQENVTRGSVRNNNTNTYYAKIQDAINAASSGDTIYVCNGTYYERLTITKTINLIGESNQNTIIKGNGSFNITGIFVTANYVNINNLNIDTFDCGVYIESASNNYITSNTITNCSIFGIYLLYSSNNNISLNTITNCGHDGIILMSSSNNAIASNNIYGNKECGLRLSSGTGNTAYNNWWGNITGPHNSNSNPIGTGDNVTDGISFIPWATAPFNTSAPAPPTQQTNGSVSIISVNVSKTLYVVNETIMVNVTIQRGSDMLAVVWDGMVILSVFDGDNGIPFREERNISIASGNGTNFSTFYFALDETGTYTLVVNLTGMFSARDYRMVNITVYTGSLMQNNTKIISPANNSEVKGNVSIRTEVITCNCTGVTALYVDGAFINNSTMNGTTVHNNIYYETFYNELNTSTLANGWHTLKMYGKHTEYFDEIRVYVNNTIAVVNHSPTITNVTANRTTVYAGEQVAINITASDQDGDILSYMYETAGVTNLGNVSNVVWTAPTTSGTYTISIKVNDNKTESNILTINITVLPASTPNYSDFVVINSLATDKSSYTTGEKIRVTVISQRGSDMLAVVWNGNVTLRVLNSNGAEVFRTAKNVSVANAGGSGTTYFDLILNDIGNYTIETTLSGMFDVLSAKGVSISVKLKTDDGGGGKGFIPGFELLTLIAGLVTAITLIRKSKIRREKI